MSEAERAKANADGGESDPASRELPDWFDAVAEDVLEYCRPKQGLWVDLGCGSGGLGFALAQVSESAILLIDPNADALAKAVERARASGLSARVVPIVSSAEHIPLAEKSVDLVTSRGSIFFWKDPPQGLREVYRILRPGGRALVGGGFGTSYPAWAHKEFFRRCRDSRPKKENRTEEEKPAERAERPYETVRPWNEPRRPEWLAEQVQAAGIEAALVEPTPPGLWLLFERGRT